MFDFHKKETLWAIANEVAKEICRRGFPAEAKPFAVTPAMSNGQKYAIVVPGRGVAAIGSDLNVIVVSPNKPLPQATVFEYESAEAAAESILRDLPLP